MNTWYALAAFWLFAWSANGQDDYTLLVFGDSGTGSTKQRRVAEAMAQACREAGCDAALVLGDLIYPRGVKSVDDSRFRTHFEEPYAALGPFPFWMAPGNHDHKRADSVDAQIANAAVGGYVDELVRECGVQFYFAGHDHHQEHISTASFEQFVQGAAARLRAVRTVRYPAELRMTQQFARSARGFAVATFTERTMEVRFIDGADGRAREICRCRATLESPACMPRFPRTARSRGPNTVHCSARGHDLF